MTAPTDAVVDAPARGHRSRLRELVARRPDVVWDPPAWLAVASVVIVAAVYAFVVWGADEPVFRADEMGNIGNARVIAFGGRDWVLNGSGYMPAFGVLLAPVWWFTSNVEVVYHAGLALNVAMATLTVWPLARVARYAGATPRAAVIIAAAVMLAPARTIPANYVLGETVTALATAATAAAAISFARRPTIRAGVLAGLASASVFLAHGRGVVIVVAVGAWALLYLKRHRAAGLALGISAGLGALAAFGLYRWIVANLYWSDARLDTLSPVGRTLPDVAGTAIGMTWYATAAWPAVAILGVALLVKRLRPRDPSALLLGALVLAIGLATLSLDKTDVASAATRLDLWVYGRYIDHLLTVVAVIGLAALVRVRWWAVSAGALAAAGALGVLFLLVTVPQIPVGGYWVDIHVAGISHLLNVDAIYEGVAEPWGMLVGAMIAITALLLAAALVRGLSVLLLLAYFGALSIAADATRVDARDANYRVWAEPTEHALGLAPADAVIGMDADYGLFINPFAYFGTPRTIYPTDASGDAPVDLTDRVDHLDIVISYYAPGAPAAAGARRIIGADVAEMSLWAYPGPIADALDADGLLAPVEAADVAETG